MALLGEYALTPDVFDEASYSSEEVCGLHLQALKEVLLQEGLVRDLREGGWRSVFQNDGRSWHKRGKELLRKLAAQNRLVGAGPARPAQPSVDAEWCEEALASHVVQPLKGIVATDPIAALHSGSTVVSAVSKLSSASWWSGRSPSLRLGRTMVEYEAALELVLRHANSLMFIDPYIDPSDSGRFGDLLRLLTSLAARSSKPTVEIHRAAWISGDDKRPQIDTIVRKLTPNLERVATTAGISIEVFLWPGMHDRYLISDLIGISLPHGFATTTAPGEITTWTRLGRADRDSVQRQFDASQSPQHRFSLP